MQREEKTKRLLYQLMLAQLLDDGYASGAGLISELTLIPANKIEGIKDRLWDIVKLGLKTEEEMVNSNNNKQIVSSDLLDSNVNHHDSSNPQSSNHSNSSMESSKTIGIDFDGDLNQMVPRPVFNTKFITTHKGACRVAKFSPDGKYVATGSADFSIKVLDAEKMKSYNQNKAEHGEDFAPSKPVIRTFYDHAQAVNDLDFHPSANVLVSCSRDNTIKFYDYVQNAVKRGFGHIQDSHNVRTLNFHPSGDYLIVGTEQPTIRLYDVETSQGFTNDRPQDNHLGPINQIRYCADATMYASCSKDGSIKLWDGVSNKSILTIPNAHMSREVTSVQFSKNQKYILSGGKDATIRIWDVKMGRQLRSIVTSKEPWKNRLQVTFNWNEDFIFSSDESTNSVSIWNTRTGEIVHKLIGHTSIVSWIASSPTENALMTCSIDQRARFWFDEK
eukprot:TRINITY_DN3042_c1_g2_i1.p1 TRINITY_DN3042_c1_g2~~TRINITY_DN3042_c1_g2_i1.p1  ORF type:complete len:445 (-),score=78.67 TRINITY_DN3042_c1_g2_i1:36-1370(-)